MEDARDVLKEDKPFSYKILKDGKAQVFWFNKMVKVLTEKETIKLNKAILQNDEYALQLFLAKITGNFKRGNER